MTTTRYSPLRVILPETQRLARRAAWIEPLALNRDSGLYDAVIRARERAHLDSKIQPFRGLRKYFENSLDAASVDHEKKMILEGHFAGTRAKHYTDRDWDELRAIYKQAYPYISVDTDDTGLGKRILGLEQENNQLQQRVKSLEGQLENADLESMGKLQAAARSMGFDISVLVDAILKEAAKRQKQPVT